MLVILDDGLERRRMYYMGLRCRGLDARYCQGKPDCQSSQGRSGLDQLLSRVRLGLAVRRL